MQIVCLWEITSTTNLNNKNNEPLHHHHHPEHHQHQHYNTNLCVGLNHHHHHHHEHHDYQLYKPLCQAPFKAAALCLPTTQLGTLLTCLVLSYVVHFNVCLLFDPIYIQYLVDK